MNNKSKSNQNIYKFALSKKYQTGFIATIAVILLATFILTFSLITLDTALSFSGGVYKKELRIQANLNADACLDQVTLMVSRDYFLSGQIKIKEFGCTANISNNFNGNVVFSGQAIFQEVNSVFKREIIFTDNAINVI